MASAATVPMTIIGNRLTNGIATFSAMSLSEFEPPSVKNW